ncbi:glycerate kinase family protein [Paenibacillus nasutitermitis]|uniref:Glycerate kinase n=1 Tax=Paenibacillus nasutitermitis TaxID=1652958 RepID=A0A916Z6V3_9BACL|nr:glycerate kinase [Paenibacillus nasutitermitis]GGD77839.1 glycerate kinase [Paenibacillus nasutitermitis]
MMKFVLAPDSFKGSLSATRLISHMKQAILRVIPEADIVEIPIADGGEGLLDSLMASLGGTQYERIVTGPLGDPVLARYVILDDRVTGIIEMAQSSGLPLIPADKRDPLAATSFGTGELIVDAMDRGCRKLVIGLGGSATNDGGAGMLKALNMKLLDSQGNELTGSGESLLKLAAIDATMMDPRILKMDITVLCDVNNPLCGPDGASAVFGPQKGAGPEEVRLLERGLNRLADVALKQFGVSLREIEGGGAAGGMAATLAAILGGKLRPGIEWIMEASSLEEHLKDADILLTGEGRLDSQTFAGKAVSGLGRLSRSYGVPVIALCGSMNIAPSDLDDLGVTAALSIVNGPCTLEEAIAQTPQLLERQVENLCRILTIRSRA